MYYYINMTTNFKINSILKTNGETGDPFSGQDGTANIDMVKLEPTVLSKPKDAGVPASILASYGNAPVLLGNVNEIQTSDCSTDDCKKDYNTILEIVSIGVTTTAGGNHDLSNVVINVTNTVPSSKELQDAVADSDFTKITPAKPYGNAIVGTYQIGYENCIGGPKKLYKPSETDKKDYIIQGTDKSTITLKTTFDCNVCRIVVADSTSYALKTTVESIEAVIPTGSNPISQVLNKTDFATDGITNQYNKVIPYTGWANATQAWGKNGVWPNTPPEGDNKFWSSELNTKIGIIRDAPGTNPPTFWNNKMALQFNKDDLRLANSPEAKYSVYDGLNNMPDKFPDSLIVAGTLQQAFTPFLKFPNTTFEPVCNQKVNMTNAQSKISSPTSLETTLSNNYNIKTHITNTDMTTPLNLTLKGLQSDEDYEISLSSLYILNDDSTWAYTPGFKDFGDEINGNYDADQSKKYAEMTYVNIGHGHNSKYQVSEGVLNYAAFSKAVDGPVPPTVTSRLPSGKTIKNTLCVNVGTVMVTLFGKEVLFNRFPIQPSVEVPDPPPVYGNFYGHYLSEDWGYELVFNSPDSYKNPSNGLGENNGKWVLYNSLEYDTTGTNGKLDFTSGSNIKQKTPQLIAESTADSYSCLLPVNNIIDTNGKIHPNISWPSTIKDSDGTDHPFVVKQICVAEIQ